MECRLKKLEKIDTFFEETKNLKTSKAHWNGFGSFTAKFQQFQKLLLAAFHSVWKQPKM